MKELKEYIVNENNFFKNLGVGQKTLIKKWIEENCKLVLDASYTINDDMTIDVDGSIIIDEYDKKELPDYIQFNKVRTRFTISSDKLESLRGCPIVCDYFSCQDCNNLKKIDYSPKECNSFSCSNCDKLESLKGISENCKYIYCSNCNSLKNLEGIKSKKLEKLSCSNCKNLESLKGSPKNVSRLDCSNCENLMSLEHCPNYMLLYINCKKCGGKFTSGYLHKNGIYAHQYDVDKEPKLKR